jgi:hypothetical protein
VSYSHGVFLALLLSRFYLFACARCGNDIFTWAGWDESLFGGWMRDARRAREMRYTIDVMVVGGSSSLFSLAEFQCLDVFYTLSLPVQ